MPPADLDAWLVEYNAATTQASHGQDADTDSDTPHLYCAFCTSYPPSGLTLICRDDGEHGALTRYQWRSSLLTNNGLIIGMVSQSDLLHRAEQRLPKGHA
jgi:hypothetical protein